MTLTVAVDGSALGNPGPAGWAWAISATQWDAGGWDHGTNNLGELTAIQQILIATAEAGMADEPLHLVADSQYAINVITKWMHGWKKRGWTKADKKPIANLDVIQDIDRLLKGRAVTFEWVRGHTGHPLNELADDKAREAAELHQAGHVAPGGPGLGSAASAHAGLDLDQAQRGLVEAWLKGRDRVAESYLAHGFERVWPNGSVTPSFMGACPPGAELTDMHVRELGGAYLVVYTMTWEGGQSRETSVWISTADGPRIIHHQSTMLA